MKHRCFAAQINAIETGFLCFQLLLPRHSTLSNSAFVSKGRFFFQNWYKTWTGNLPDVTLTSLILSFQRNLSFFRLQNLILTSGSFLQICSKVTFFWQSHNDSHWTVISQPQTDQESETNDLPQPKINESGIINLRMENLKSLTCSKDSVSDGQTFNQLIFFIYSTNALKFALVIQCSLSLSLILASLSCFQLVNCIWIRIIFEGEPFYLSLTSPNLVILFKFICSLFLSSCACHFKTPSV